VPLNTIIILGKINLYTYIVAVYQCSRCIKFTAQNNRQTNGHQFMFHSSEVVGSVRLYVSGELSILLSLLSPASPTWALARMPGLLGSGLVASSSGAGLISGLFFSAGEGEVEMRRDSRRSSESRDGRQLGRERDVTRCGVGSWVLGCTHQRKCNHEQTCHPVKFLQCPRLLYHRCLWFSQRLYLSCLVFHHGSSTEEVGQYDDDSENEEPPSLVTSSGDISS
jgi:hypothetical protein